MSPFFFNGKDLIAKLHEKPDLISLDYTLPDLTGDEIPESHKRLRSSYKRDHHFCTRDIGTAVNLLKLEAFDYIM